jgi:hypothetical protein
MRSCTLQRTTNVSQRHDVLWRWRSSRAPGYLVEIESSFPAHVTTQRDAQKGGRVHCVSHSQERGDLLVLLPNNTCECDRGEAWRIRTPDLSVTRHVLYTLS